RLLKDSNLEAWEDDLRRATSAAEKAHPTRSGFVLTCKLIPCIFKLEELAQSRGQGLRKKKEADLRPVLDPTKLGDLKEYVNLWCHKNNKDSVKDLDFNDAISEKVSYARRKLKTFQRQ
ncbi:hypothetical protein FSP39_007213, partial [Pinctada imbricata]